MATKTFSGRADATKLEYVDNLTQREFGMSYGQYCSSLLLDGIYSKGVFPPLTRTEEEIEKRREALNFILDFPSHIEDPSIGKLTDEEIKDLLASRNL